MAGLSALGFTYWTIPTPYPPFAWAPEARGVFGLGPFKHSLSGVAVEEFSKSENFPLKLDRRMAAEFAFPVQIRVRRDLIGYSLNSEASFEERRRLEATLLEAMSSSVSTYHPLPGSKSQPNPMTNELLDSLRAKGLMFEAPWTNADLAKNFGRFWPDARGVGLTSADALTAVWVNHEHHLEVVGVGPPEACWKAVSELLSSLNNLQFQARKGHGTTVSCVVGLPRVGMHENFFLLCAKLRVCPVMLKGGLVNIVSFETVGLEPEETVIRTTTAVAELLEIEKKSPREADARIATLLG